MACILIVSIDPVIRHLLRDLTALAGHTPKLPARWDSSDQTPADIRPAVLLLDAALRAPVRDGWLRRAADLGACIVYFASTLSEAELEAFAGLRNAPYFALPNGPKRLGQVLSGALRAREQNADAEVAAARGCAHEAGDRVLLTLAALAQARSQLTLADTRLLLSESRRLRVERELLLADAALHRDALHAAVSDFAHALRAAGAPAERALAAARTTLAIAAPRTSAPTSLVLEPAEADSWVLEAYSLS